MEAPGRLCRDFNCAFFAAGTSEMWESIVARHIAMAYRQRTFLLLWASVWLCSRLNQQDESDIT